MRNEIMELKKTITLSTAAILVTLGAFMLSPCIPYLRMIVGFFVAVGGVILVINERKLGGD